MDIKKEYGTSKELEKEGVWIEVGEDAKIRVCRANNKKYMKEIEKLSRPYKKQIRRGTISGEKFDSIVIEASAKFILVDWEGIKEDGVTVDYTPEQSLRLLTDFPDFREVVSEIAMDFNNFKEEETKESEGNLETTSSGPSE